MEKDASVAMRLNLTGLMQDRKYSPYTRFSVTYHVANINEREPGDEIVRELMVMVESGMTEQEFRQTAEAKFGIKMFKEGDSPLRRNQ